MRGAAERIVLGGWIAGFAFGATMHAIDFVRMGPFPYTHGPPVANLFWDALLFVDLGLCALLLTGKRRLGLALGVALMVADVAVNIWASGGLGGGFHVALLMQSGFLGFLLGSVGFLWPLRSAK